MPWIPRAEVRRLKEIDLLTYLRKCEPWELKRVTAREYTTHTHGSLKISNGKWNWWKADIGGISALDYLIKIRGYDFLKAAEILRQSKIVMPTRTDIAPRSKPPVPTFMLPERNENEAEVLKYLHHERGIDEEILYDCIARGLLYEDKKYHSVVFVGFDDSGKAAYGAYRATNGMRQLGELRGSQKKYAFRFCGDERKSVHIFESAIDLLSWLTLEKLNHRPWRSLCSLSMSGVAGSGAGEIPAPLKHFLEKNTEVKTVYIHFDRDEAGKNAANALAEKLLRKQYDVAIYWPREGKDVNDELRKRREKE